MASKADRTVRFTYVDDPENRTVYVNHLVGSVHPHNELRFDLVEEFRHPPQEEECVIDQQGRIASARLIQPEGFIRLRKVSVVVPMSEVPRIIRWLQTKLDEHCHASASEDSGVDES